MAGAGVSGEDFNDLRGKFMGAHHGMLGDPRNDVEALDRAGCGPRVTDLARLAIAVCADGRSAEGWHMDQRRARSRIATSSRGGGGLHARERALAHGGTRALGSRVAAVEPRRVTDWTDAP